MLTFSCGISLFLRSVSNCIISMSFMFLLSLSIFSFCKGYLLMLHSMMLWSERKCDFVMFWTQLWSALCVIQCKVLPALCVGKFIIWCRLNVLSISAMLPVSIWSDEFHGILKCPSIVGWEFSFNTKLRSQEILPEKLAFALDSFLIMLVCKLKQRKPVEAWQLVHQMIFYTVLTFWTFNPHLWMHIVPLLSYLYIHVR